MIKADIVKAVAERLKLKDKEALQIVDATIEAFKEVICENGRLEVRDFGVFQVKERKARVGRNPRNKMEYPIPPRRVVTFKLGKELKDHSIDTSAEAGGHVSQTPRDAGQTDGAPPAPGAGFSAESPSSAPDASSGDHE